MSTHEQLAQRYIALWTRPFPPHAAAASRRSGATTPATSTRWPTRRATRRSTRTIAAVQEQFPGFEFRLAGPVDGHHDLARFTWELGPAGAEAPIVGFDVAVTGGDGRLRSVLGFLDRVPAGSAA